MLPKNEAQWRDAYLAKFPNTAFGRGTFWRYGAGAWETRAEQEVRRELADLLGDAAENRLISAVLKLVEDRAFVRDERWDGRVNVLVFTNCTLDLDTLALRGHDPEDYAVTRVPYAYDPTATAPAWEQYLLKTMPDVQGFVQEFLGLALTPDMSYEITLWLVGPPGAGRSTFIQAAEAMLGQQQCAAVNLRQIVQSQYGLASVPGKRLLVATEQPSIYIESSDRFNAIVSGDTIQIEGKYKDPYDLRPICKMLWAMNDLPNVKSPNDGIFRRVKVVPMDPIPPEAQDTTIKARVAAEAPGILNWALEGLKRLRARGRFDVPERVKDATAAWKQSTDVVASFIEERCEAGDEYCVWGGELYEHYRKWCEEYGHKAKSNNSLAADLKRLGFERKTLCGRGRWKGLRLVPRMPIAASEGEEEETT